MKIDLKKVKSIHFVGIKGVAMTALAIVAKEMGKKVSGSDTDEEFPTSSTLNRFAIAPAIGFNPKHVPAGVDLVIYTGAHQGVSNPEVAAAIKKHLPILPHGKALGLFMQGKRQISVSGSHGKTTTSALVAGILTELNMDPSFAVGCGEITNLHTSGHYGNGEWFLAEADEYATDPVSDKTPRFLWQYPEILIITNIDFDHPDIYANLQEVQDAFITFGKNVTANGIIVLNADDPASTAIKDRIIAQIVTYGKSADSDFQFHSIKMREGNTKFSVTNRGTNLGAFELKIPGIHNVANATAAIAGLVSKGLSASEIRRVISKFAGTKRRFELVASKRGKLLYDDYAHHPAEITATIQAARAWFPHRRIVAIFQPHTYSRTKILLTDFARSLSLADEIVITKIYASAREQPDLHFSAEKLHRAIKTYSKNAFLASEKSDVLQYLGTHTSLNDLIIVMGAGDIYTWLPQMIEEL